MIPSAVLGHEISKAHGLTLSQGFDRVVCLLLTHLHRHELAAGKDGRIGRNFGFVWSGLIY